MSWASIAVKKGVEVWPEVIGPIVDLLRCKVVQVSTCCSGIDTPVLSLRMLAGAVNRVSVGGHGGNEGAGEGMRVSNKFAVEKNGHCIEEFLWQDVADSPPEHIFPNMLEFLSEPVKAAAERIPHDKIDETRSVILREPLLRKARRGRADDSYAFAARPQGPSLRIVEIMVD
eukprot:8766936-Alexandrium_andersonii.AAC.1